MDIGLFMGIILAVFAVFGLCSLVKLTAEALIVPEKYAVAIICDEKTDPEEIGFLVNRARTAWHRRGGNRMVVLIHKGIKIPQETVNLLLESNIQIYLVSAYPENDEENKE